MSWGYSPLTNHLLTSWDIQEEKWWESSKKIISHSGLVRYDEIQRSSVPIIYKQKIRLMNKSFRKHQLILVKWSLTIPTRGSPDGLFDWKNEGGNNQQIWDYSVIIQMLRDPQWLCPNFAFRTHLLCAWFNAPWDWNIYLVTFGLVKL